MVPYERNCYFTGRSSQFECVRRKLSQAVNDHHRVAVYGLGGVGKTQFVLEYLYRFRGDYEFCFWISGIDRTSLLSGLMEIGERLGFKPSRADITTEEKALELVQWLPLVSRWILVIDNVDNINIFDSLRPTGTLHSHILITTRSANFRGLPAQVFEMPVLSADEAKDMLLCRADVDFSQETSKEAEEIVKELGYLPLAIEQAAGYIRESCCSILVFREIYRSHQQTLLSRCPRGSKFAYSESIATTWLLSLQKLQKEGPNATKLLTLFAFLNPDEILIEFLQSGSAGLDEPLKSLIMNNCALNELLTSLADFSLIRRYQGGKSIAMHRLVQTVMKDGLSSEERAVWRRRSLELSMQAFPWPRQKDIAVHRRYRSQVMLCITGSDVEQSESATELMARMSWYLDCEAQYSEAVLFAEQTIKQYKKILGTKNPKVFVSMDRLAWTYMKQGRLSEATDLFQAALAGLRRSYGKDDKNTLACQRNLGRALMKQGKIADGMAFLEEACVIQRKVDGEGNPRTQATMRKLATAYLQQGQFEKAIELLEAVYRHVINDPRGICQGVRRELGWAYCQQERISDGIALLEIANAWQTSSLGPGHPNTLLTSLYLGWAYLQQDRERDGITMLEETRLKHEMQLGEEHEDTLRSIRFLVRAYKQQGRLDESTSLIKELKRRRGEWDENSPIFLDCSV